MQNMAEFLPGKPLSGHCEISRLLQHLHFKMRLLKAYLTIINMHAWCY